MASDFKDKDFLLTAYRNGIVKLIRTSRHTGRECYEMLNLKTILRFPKLYPARVKETLVFKGQEIKIYEMGE